MFDFNIISVKGAITITTAFLFSELHLLVTNVRLILSQRDSFSGIFNTVFSSFLLLYLLALSKVGMNYKNMVSTSFTPGWSSFMVFSV